MEERADVPEIDARVIERIFREEYGRAVAVLVRQFGDIDAAEEAVQDAFTTALERWPSAGLPASPVGWIITTARNRAIDLFSPWRPPVTTATRKPRFRARTTLSYVERSEHDGGTPCATIDCG